MLAFEEISSVHKNRRFQILDIRIETIVKRVRKKMKTFLKRNLPPRGRRPTKEVENQQQQKRQLKRVKKRKKKKRKTNPKRGEDERVCSARNATGA